MPGPAVYVVVAVVGAVATGYAIKEFIYDPHIAPIIRDWREQRRAHRTSQRRMHSPVPATSEYRSPHGNHPSPIELDTVVASEVDEWRSSSTMRHRQTNNVLDERVPYEVDHPIITPSTPVANSPPHVLRSPTYDNIPMRLSQPPSSPAALSIPDLASFATDIDYTASSVDVTPLTQTGVLQSNLTSPQFTVTSPFSDIFELAQSRISETEIARANSGSDDEDDNDSLGSGESWHDIRNEVNRF